MSLIHEIKEEIDNITINKNFERLERFILGLLNYDDLEFTSNPNPEDEVLKSHKLGKIPTKFIQTYSEHGSVLMPGDAAWSETQVSFKATLGNCNMKVRIM